MFYLELETKVLSDRGFSLTHVLPEFSPLHYSLDSGV